MRGYAEMNIGRLRSQLSRLSSKLQWIPIASYRCVFVCVCVLDSECFIKAAILLCGCTLRML